MTPFVSKNPREAFFNYKDLDLGINHNGKNSYEEGRVYGVEYFKDNFDRLVQIKTKVDPRNFFRNEQSIPTLPQNGNWSYIYRTLFERWLRNHVWLINDYRVFYCGYRN